MATVLMPVEEYLRSPGRFEPDAEYVDGEIQERSMGEDSHSAWQLAIMNWFLRNADTFRVRIRPELRVQVSPTRYRVPDVSILDAATPKEEIAVTPPIAVFEVLSPEDTVKRVREKLRDYEAMGIAGIFLVDPDTGVFERYRAGQLTAVERFDARGIGFAFSEIARLVF